MPTNQSAKPRDLTLVFLTFQSRLVFFFHILNFKCAHRLSGASIFEDKRPADENAKGKALGTRLENAVAQNAEVWAPASFLC